MKIREMDKSRMRNDEHFMFHTEVHDLIMRVGAENLRVASPFARFVEIRNKLDDGFKKIVRSALTEQIQDEDKKRDFAYAGMVELANAMLKNPNVLRSEAAKRLVIVFNTYGNISKKPLNEQTSAVINILQELKGPYLEDARTLGLVDDYMLPLEASNITLKNLVRDRYDEATAKSHVVVREARQELDAVYDEIVAIINAVALLEGGEVCENFIATLNTIIEKYTAIINIRLGKKHKPDAGESEQEAETP